MEKTATPQAKPKNKHFWNFQPASGDNPPELILYGDIASETWWGDEVTPRQFTEELDALGAVPEIVVRINSGGGDVFAANAIYTRLKDNAAKITVKIDGWAASAATIIAMAGDSIEIPGNGVFMVHDPALGLLGYFNETELAKMTDELKVIKQSIVNAYTLKTGKDAADVAAIMAAETWYDGKQAVDAGFCDKLMFEDAETTVENAAKVVVNSVSLDLTRFPNIGRHAAKETGRHCHAVPAAKYGLRRPRPKGAVNSFSQKSERLPGKRQLRPRFLQLASVSLRNGGGAGFDVVLALLELRRKGVEVFRKGHICGIELNDSTLVVVDTQTHRLPGDVQAVHMLSLQRRRSRGKGELAGRDGRSAIGALPNPVDVVWKL